MRTVAMNFDKWLEMIFNKLLSFRYINSMLIMYVQPDRYYCYQFRLKEEVDYIFFQYYIFCFIKFHYHIASTDALTVLDKKAFHINLS